MEELAKVEAKLRDVPDIYAVFFDPGSALLSVPGRNTITQAERASRLLDARRRSRTSARSRWSTGCCGPACRLP
jgi:hypothetical protein